jgi:enterobactin synthetase component D
LAHADTITGAMAVAETASRGFVEKFEQVDAGQGCLLRARFHYDRFDPLLFELLEIPLPLRLSTAVERRRAEYLAGRLTAQVALGGDAAPLMGQDKLPVWPKGLSGSLSHARGHVACLIRSCPGVGVDVEAIATGPGLRAILHKALRPEEEQLFAALSESELSVQATLVFSAKETLFKALYPRVGHVFGFQAACLCERPVFGRLRLRLCETLASGLTEGQEFTLSYQVRSDSVLTWTGPGFLPI